MGPSWKNPARPKGGTCMRKVLLALVGVILVLGGIAPSVADPADQPGKSNYGHCTAITHMNENGFDHGNAFRIYDDLDGDGNNDDDDDDSTNDFAEAIAYCQDFLSDPENRPGKSGDNKDD